MTGTVKLTDAQRRIASQMLKDGRVELSQGSSADYRAAAIFIFENGL